MNTIIHKWILALLMAFANAAVHGATTAMTESKIEYEGVWYYVNEVTKEARAIGLAQAIEQLVIPDNIKDENGTEYPVTAIGSSAFRTESCLRIVTIGKNVKVIESGAFCICNLESVSLPEGLVKIGIHAFAGCSFKEIHIPNSVESIEYGAFEDTKLVKVVLPKNLKLLDSYPFIDCDDLKEVVIPDGAATVVGNIFINCNNVEHIYFGSDVKEIRASAVRTQNVRVTISPENETYDSRDDCNAVIHTATNTLVSGNGMTTIPPSVTAIGDYAFFQCYGLQHIDIPPSVVTIGTNAFSSCIKLQSVYLTDNVKTIGKEAFCSSGIEKIRLPIGLKRIEMGTFSRCKKLKSIDIPEGVEVIGMDDMNYILGQYDFPPFYECRSLTTVKFPSTLRIIGPSTFAYCNSLAEIELPDNLELIRHTAFAYATNLTKVKLPSSACAFDLGEEQAWSHGGPFIGCINLNCIIQPAESPQDISPETFLYLSSNPNLIYENATLYVPQNTVNLYKSLSGWKLFKNIQGVEDINDIPDDIEGIEPDAAASAVSIHDIQGRSLQAPCKGLNIIKYSDGTVRKEWR